MWNRHVMLAALALLGDKGELGPPCRLDHVVELERRLDVRLPESYRDFVLRIGDSGAGPGQGLWSLGRSIRWADRGVYAPRYLATPFPFTARVPGEYFDDLDEDGHHDDPLTGSMIIAEIGHGAYFRMVVTGATRGRVWRDDVGLPGGALSPGLDFADWYTNWLQRLGVLNGPPRGRRRLV
ncbi:SMI1/KNR4 family protein [Actinomadura madurae]|uniref:SMI1/KNR4 family protein n=1 Tax=Actinomadura madurae TaxID=1993 RepID=UPI0020D229A0|nr:SMI1/KNR4 family protein [Actinomadura madurae]MCP9952931.1 SMI1/KNR4 family protein [Actinomadura madurae]MCP9969694.1 SMI1/KNR4 family protein [Actinomadura madurae]MCP9982149.1 SMI1/KNR4 family protein [Actinomadura madurae]MCQ0006323.1 SMI1/KNR4 family protein [Actinomadura madurae]MCQ0018395.1 SMI1/KNR4 family protein [Actinomadura madurae]